MRIESVLIPYLDRTDPIKFQVRTLARNIKDFRCPELGEAEVTAVFYLRYLLDSPFVISEGVNVSSFYFDMKIRIAFRGEDGHIAVAGRQIHKGTISTYPTSPSISFLGS